MTEVDIPLSALAQRIRDRAAARSGRYLLGIAGPPGVGKSTLSAALRGELGELAEIAPMDGYHLTNEVLRAAGNLARKGEPDTFDTAGYLENLRRLRNSPIGEPIPWPTFDRTLHDPVPGGLRIARQPIVITEGNYLLLDDVGAREWSAVRELLDECWYLDGSAEIRTNRLLARHINGGRTPDAARAKVYDSDLRNADLIAKTKPRADLVLREHEGKYYTVRG